LDISLIHVIWLSAPSRHALEPHHPHLVDPAARANNFPMAFGFEAQTADSVPYLGLKLRRGNMANSE
jgi:hypothetical protein